MKKFLFSVIALFGMSMSMSAQTASLTVDDVEAVPGETVTATLKFTLPENYYGGFVFAFQFPATGFTVDKTSEDAFGGIKNYQIGTMEDGYLKYSGATNTPFAASTVFTAQFTVAEDVALGDYTVKVTDIRFDHDGTMEDIAEATFTVKVVDVHAIVLDENATEAPAAATGVNVTVKRTINANEWSTICLPFDMDVDQVAKAFGEDVQLAELTGWSSEKDGDAIVGITVEFETVDEIEANTPYIIKVGAPVSEFTLENVDIDPDENPNTKVGKSSARGYLYGTYAVTKVPEKNVFLSENKFWYSTGSTTIKAFRGYFEFAVVLNAYTDATAGSRIKMAFDDETTGISGVNFNVDGEYYNLNGLRVETPAKGVYIKDGKKVVVK